MQLATGISHVATVTEDLERMLGFYARIFDAEVSEVMEEDGLRHAFVFLGGDVALHPFQVPWATLDDRREMFDRGRIDHFGVTVPTSEALEEVRRRLRAEGVGVTDDQVRDFGQIYSLHFVDPDGVHLEVNLFKDGWRDELPLPKKDWKVVDTVVEAAV